MPDPRRLSRLSEIETEPIRWLWPDRIPRGSITLLDGDPGTGKSLITYDLAARVTAGKAMPATSATTQPGGVILLQGEDDASTIKQNLLASGAAIERVVAYDRTRFVEQPLRLPEDMPLVENAVAEIGAALLVIDPITSFFTANATSDQSVRSALHPLTAFAARTGLSIVIVRLLIKSASSNPMYRGAGSIAFIAAARSALQVATDPSKKDPFNHVLLQLKGNLASAASLNYRTLRQNGGMAIEWLGESKLTARELGAAAREEHSKLHEAAVVLYGILAEGPVWASEAMAVAGRAGVSKRTLDRAKKLLGVVVRKWGSGRGSRWSWQLPEDPELLRRFRSLEIDDLMDRLIYGADMPPVPDGNSRWRQT